MRANKETPADGDGEPEVSIDRSDERAREALREKGPVDPQRAASNPQELAERIAHLEDLLGVHDE